MGLPAAWCHHWQGQLSSNWLVVWRDFLAGSGESVRTLGSDEWATARWATRPDWISYAGQACGEGQSDGPRMSGIPGQMDNPSSKPSFPPSHHALSSPSSLFLAHWTTIAQSSIVINTGRCPLVKWSSLFPGRNWPLSSLPSSCPRLPLVLLLSLSPLDNDTGTVFDRWTDIIQLATSTAPNINMLVVVLRSIFLCHYIPLNKPSQRNVLLLITFAYAN